jgi:pyrroline-5-carboxylate reductase
MIMPDYPIIAIIGAGTMGEAIIAGLLRTGLTTPERIRCADPRQDRIAELQARYNVKPFIDNVEAIDDANIVILSVKPQKMDRVLAGLKNHIPKQALVLSIVAGVSISTIAQSLNHPSVVRSMPNTPAQIGEGITVWTSSAKVTPQQKDYAQRVLNAFGEEIYVEPDEENFLDMATALSGSGPAYIFLFMEAMIDAGVHLGFPRHISEKLVTQTMRGSVNYFDKMKAHPAHLRNEVTSPGGTSAAALYYLEKAGIRTAISRAIWAAYERSQALGKGKETQPPENYHD